MFAYPSVHITILDPFLPLEASSIDDSNAGPKAVEPYVDNTSTKFNSCSKCFVIEKEK